MYDNLECKVNTSVFNVYLFTTIPHSEARRVSVNYVIAGVNGKDSVQMSCKLLADV